jgi:hypothetical protein
MAALLFGSQSSVSSWELFGAVHLKVAARALLKSSFSSEKHPLAPHCIEQNRLAFLQQADLSSSLESALAPLIAQILRQIILRVTR